MVNALSTRLEAMCLRDGEQWFQYYNRSAPGMLETGRASEEERDHDPVLGRSRNL